jgi:hypothetical protein
LTLRTRFAFDFAIDRPRRRVGRGSFAPEENPLRAVRGLAWGLALSVPAWLLLALVLWIIAGAA